MSTQSKRKQSSESTKVQKIAKTGREAEKRADTESAEETEENEEQGKEEGPEGELEDEPEEEQTEQKEATTEKDDELEEQGPGEEEEGSSESKGSKENSETSKEGSRDECDPTLSLSDDETKSLEGPEESHGKSKRSESLEKEEPPKKVACAYTDDQYKTYLLMQRGILNSICPNAVGTTDAATKKYLSNMTTFLKRQSGDPDLFGVDYMNTADRSHVDITIVRLDKDGRYVDRVHFPWETLPYTQYVALVLSGALQNGTLFHTSVHYANQHLLGFRTDHEDRDRFVQAGGSGHTTWIAQEGVVRAATTARTTRKQD